MARAVLVACVHPASLLGVLVILMNLSSEARGTNAAGAPSCPRLLVGAGKRLQQHYREFRHAVEHGAFYRTMVQRLGAVQSCRAQADKQTIRLVYEATQGASLVARRDPAIEFSEQLLTMSGLDQPTAITLLREVEQDFFSAAGCGIAWSSPHHREAASTAGAYDLVYRGDVCNCQGRLHHAQGGLVALTFRSAC